MKKNILGLFLDKLFVFPLWVKQVIYLKLYRDLQKDLSENFISLKEDEVFHLQVPILTFAGKTELAERNNNYDSNVYVFIANIEEGLNILEIAMNNCWTMEEVSKCYIICLEQNYIKTPESIYIPAMAGFMSGKYRTGEYFKRVGRINVDQLEQIIIKQKEYNQQGNPKKMAEIMIEMGLITEQETISLLKIKEESKKRFILDSSIVPAENQNNKDLVISKLKEENEKLKDQLRKILSLVKKSHTNA